jgi:hypothetical protein
VVLGASEERKLSVLHARPLTPALSPEYGGEGGKPSATL